MNKILFRKPDFDKTLGITRPSFLPKNWHALYEQNKIFNESSGLKELIIDEHSALGVVIRDGQFIETRCKMWNEIFDIDVEWIDRYNGKKYFYYIPIIPSDYFFHMQHIGFSGLEEDVKKDIRNGICKIVLLATDEGYFGESKDIYSTQNWDLEIIQKWLDIEKFPTDSLIFICMNSIAEIHNEKKSLNFKILPTTWMSESHIQVEHGYENVPANFIELKDDSKLFLTYNFAYHPHRLYLLESLHKNNLLNDSYHSFIFNQNRGVWNFGLSEYKKINSDMLCDGFDDLMDMIPIKIEDDLKDEDYGGSDSKGQVVVDNHYENTFVSVVSETLSKNDTVYFSEKTFKPIYKCHPFILVSSKGSIKKLKELGYQTFDKWWDESYDECDNFIDRIDMISSILSDLKNKSISERKKMKNEMKDVLVHNYHNYIGRRTKHPLGILDGLKYEYEKFVNNE